MDLDHIIFSVKERPGMYFGSLYANGVRNLIFQPLWNYYKIVDELRISLYINIKKDGIIVKIVDDYEFLLKSLDGIDRTFLHTLIPTKYVKLNYNNDKTLTFHDLHQLMEIKSQLSSLGEIEYSIDYSYFKHLTNLDKMMFELIGEARLFSAINNCKVEINDENTLQSHTFFYPDGISDYLREIDFFSLQCYPGKVYTINYQNEFGKFNLAIRPEYINKTIYSYVNGAKVNSGTHIKGLQKSIRKLNSLIKKEFSNEDSSNVYLSLFSGYTIVMNITANNCLFYGSIKDNLVSVEALDLVVDGFNEKIHLWAKEISSLKK